MNNNKRVDIDWTYLEYCIRRERYNLTSISKKIGVSPNILFDAKRDKKINPAIVVEIANVISLAPEKVILDNKIEKPVNGRSTGGRVKIKWDVFQKIVEEKGYSLYSLSNAIGRSNSYLYNCRHDGGMSNDVIEDIATVLEMNIDDLKKQIVREESVSKEKVIKMLESQQF